MNSVDIEPTIHAFLPVGVGEFRGQQDACGGRHGQGDEHWKKGAIRQKYSGKFLGDSLHNAGTYTIEDADTKSRLTYEGRVYANHLEGYGSVSYPDGSRFEGLFKGSQRYGPGVLTYSDGSQDVGLWLGRDLVRLDQPVSRPVPQLAQSLTGRSYLLNYKRLVPVQQKEEEVAERIMEDIDAGEKNVPERRTKLYSKFTRNKRSALFNKKKFNDDFFANDKDFTIEVLEPVGGSKTSIISQVLVTHLVAWNNEEVAVNFMRHTFKHRNQETTLSYNVASVLTGMRKDFQKPGTQEMRCLRFLESCCDADAQLIKYLICEHYTYPDVQDYQGNNSVTYAAVHDQNDVLKTLTDCGANVDNLNDECLTPLLISILRYIAIKFNVISWELAFLPRDSSSEFKPEIQMWRSCMFYDRETMEELQNYLFDIKCKKPIKEKDRPKSPKPKRKSKLKGIEEWEDLDVDKLQQIQNTIQCLLDCGAKPDFGDCPFPPLILSIFTKSRDIVLNLLKHKADPNIRTAYHLGNLTPLQVLASLNPHVEMLDIAEVLITNNADTELRCNIEHWHHETHVLKAGIFTEDEGKTALHILCMRYDFTKDHKEYLNQLCEVFLNLGANANCQYMGHIPLTLAMMRGNIKLMKTLLNSGLIDPNQDLGNNMGVPLTVLILKRYERHLSVHTCENVYNTLLEYYANPLCPVYGAGNAIEFCIFEYTEPVTSSTTLKSKKSGKSSKSKKSSKSSKSKKGKGKGKGKGKKKKKKKKENPVIKVLYKAAETTLLKHTCRKAVQFLYMYKIECQFTCSLFHNIVKYLNMELTLKYLQILLDHELIFPSKTFCYQLLQYVQVNSKHKKKSKKHKVTLDDQLDTLNFNKGETLSKFFTFDIAMPDIDPDDSKFKVCFECFQKTNKILVLCPKCNLIYFCSQECNIRNNKKKGSKHPCKGVFYKTELQLMLDRLEKGLPEEANIFKDFHRMREELIAKDNNYFSKIQEYDADMTQLREAEREKARKDKSKSRSRSRSKSKERKGKKGSRPSSKAKSRRSSRSGSREGRSRSRGKKGKDKDKTKKGLKDKKGGKDGSICAKDAKAKEAAYRDSLYGKGDGLPNQDTEPKRDRRLSDSVYPVGDAKLDQLGLVTEHLQKSISELCEPFSLKFFLMFMPYCAFVNGQLYYKFENASPFRKLHNYSCN